MTADGEHDDEVERLRHRVEQLEEFIASLDGIDGDDPFDFCENAMDVWNGGVSPDTAPPPVSPAMLIILETFRALAQVMTSGTVDYYSTPDARDRITRDSAQGSLTDALDGVRRDAQRWLAEGLPSAEEVKQRTDDVGASMKAALEVNAKMMADQDVDDAAAAADPCGAILGYRDPNVDVAIIFTKVCSFTEEENTRYRDAHGRLRRMLDSELSRHISDESDRFFDVLMGVLSDLRDDRISLADEDAIDERRRRLRSALISLTSALHSHKDQSIRAVRDTFGRRTPQEQAVLDLFNDLLSSSFEYRWLVEMRDALLHGDINAFKYDFTARLHGEPAVNVYMDRGYMLHFTREHRNKPWLNRSELEQRTSDPSVLDMIQAIQPLMDELQKKLDAILYPDVDDDVATVKELIGRFNGRRGLYALQTGPGFTRRLWVPPYMPLAPRVLAYADKYQTAS